MTNVTNLNGPITVVTSKKRRITIIECNNDINCMIDIAKCADLVLLLCDASFGFEMEIFEFLNICQTHGMPKIMGVLTHLDMIKNVKALRRQKKLLKHRFWTEVYQGAKLFYLSGITHGEYLRTEIRNLGRFISVMKFHTLQWRGVHSYLLADRMEDITNSEDVRLNPKCDRSVVLYGYVRGVPIKIENMVHIAGLGDMTIDELSVLPDPCPLPSAEKKRHLLEKERLLYAPMSGVGGIVYDKDAVYIELQGSHHHQGEAVRTKEQNDLVNAFLDKKDAFDVQIHNQEFKLFSDGDVIKSSEFDAKKNNRDDDDDVQNDPDSGVEERNSDSDSEEDDDDDEVDYRYLGWNGDQEAEMKPKDIDEGDSSESDEEYENVADRNQTGDDENESDDAEEVRGVSWKDNLAQKARNAYLERQSNTKNLMKIVYGVFSLHAKRNKNNTNTPIGEEDDDEEIGGLFKSISKRQSELQKQKTIQDAEECSFFENFASGIRDWTENENKNSIRNCFVTGKWKAGEDASELLQLDDMSDADSEVYGDFEDLETGEKHLADKNTVDQKDDKAENEEENLKKRKISRVEERNMTRKELLAKKVKLKDKFNSEYDNPEGKPGRQWITGDNQFYENLKQAAQKQTEINKKEFAHLDDDIRLQIEGHRAGLYVRLNFKTLPYEFVENFDPKYPVLIGSLNMAEENIGYVSCKVKKHRWYKKILKTADPLIISLGWRRFQTIPIFAKIEDDLKHRYLKYTPDHVTCNMTFWGPITPQNTGFLAVQSVSNDVQEVKRLGFRIAATGSVNEVDKSSQIMKKLKLVGAPFKIYKKSAFIKGMFNSALEVAKFEGAKIKTVSGIRGQLKKACREPPGSFRATFEDTIVLSDIVFCRTWFKVDIPQFYVSVNNLVLSHENKQKWQGMKTLGQLKREKNIQNQPSVDSLYREIKREKPEFRPLVIPRNLQKALPYKDKPKITPKSQQNNMESGRIAVIHSPHEQKVIFRLLIDRKYLFILINYFSLIRLQL